MDKDFFGHKKFSHLLSSLTNILKFIPHPSGEGQPLVVGTLRRVVEPVQVTSKPVTEKADGNGDKGRTPTQSINSSSPTIEPLFSPSSMPKETDVSTSASLTTRKAVTDPQPISMKPNADLKETSSGTTTTNTSSSQLEHVREGLFRRFWRGLTVSKAEQSNYEGAVLLDSDNNGASYKREQSQQSSVFSENTHPEDKTIYCRNEPSRSVSSHSLDVRKSTSEDKPSKQSENRVDAPNIRPRFVSRLASWWKLLLYGAPGPDSSFASIGTSAKDHNSNNPGEHVEALTQARCQPEAHDLFSQSRFWDSLELFLLDSKGTDLILKSRTREELVDGLQKESPSVLRGLEECHLHHLVDLLVSEMKWVQESTSRTFPFTLVIPLKKGVPSHSQNSNGLSSLFTNGTSQPKQEQGPDLAKKKKTPSREEILSDCHKLLVELLKENPDGFNMCVFKPAFIQRYGYMLDHQMLGYPKLASLLLIMPGVRLESSFILPAGKFHSDSGSEKLAAAETISHPPEDDGGKTIDLKNKGWSNGEESVWEELGPVSNIGDNTSFSEASLSDVDFTDSEDDAPQFTESEGWHKGDDKDSSLLRILDSWYSSKEGLKEQPQPVDGLVDCSKNNVQNTSDQKALNFSKIKTKHNRKYSFVSDSGDEKVKLVDSILESLKKGGDSRLHS
ncbi:hypothetical protein J5N97_012027 [Dioscorea zingiberensis]|uniref:HTH OST-type domain-containing protein n=1 Tax=Dioscorea zingiberensis TaxID=325984 RepID=A0A9D5CQP0_9LILI|nr:hypothetical protein J5N97_012027 [Dioscorea zingiberensis]